jgi:hypothetical protein
MDSSGNTNFYIITLTVAGLESVDKVKQRKCLEAAVQTKI